MSKVPYEFWADYVVELARLAGRPIVPGTKLLDLATGTGSVALKFAARGCATTGIDVCEPMLAEGRRKAAESGLDVSFHRRDLSDFHLPAEFDHAVCLYDSLNYILDVDLLKHAFVNTRTALAPGGLFIFDVNTVHALAAELFTQRSPPAAAIEYRWTSAYDSASRCSLITMKFRIPASNEDFTIQHCQRAYTDAELRCLLTHAGFVEITTFDAYQFVPPRQKSDRVFYVARAPATDGP
jgi:ubiquinone/menaquinone biosynthesis C-methylase UbiE